MSELYQNPRKHTTSLAARAAINAGRRSYKAFCAGRRKALATFARAPDRQHVVYTAIVVFARRNCDGSITRCIAPLFYAHAGQLIGDLRSSDEVAGATFRDWFALSQRCGSIVADHILPDRRPQ